MPVILINEKYKRETTTNVALFSAAQPMHMTDESREKRKNSSAQCGEEPISRYSLRPRSVKRLNKYTYSILFIFMSLV